MVNSLQQFGQKQNNIIKVKRNLSIKCVMFTSFLTLEQLESS